MALTEYAGDMSPYLRAIAANPADETCRLVFADWLEEHGDWRAEFLRLDHAIATDTDRTAESKQLWDFLWPRLPREWQVVIARSPIERCTDSAPEKAVGDEKVSWPRFKYQCPLTWENLQPTEKDTVRFCTVCSKSVHFCRWVEDARFQASLGHCVALSSDARRYPGDLAPEDRQALMGVLDIESFTRRGNRSE